MVSEKLKKALESLEYPVSRLIYVGDADTYFTFQAVASVPDGYADDDSTVTFHVFRIDLFSKANYTAVLKEAKKAIKNAGFTIASVDGEIYENDTKFYHVPITVNFLEEE